MQDLATIIDLIKQSQSIPEIEKQTLIATIKFLPQDKIDQLARIFTIEKEGLSVIEKDFVSQSSEINKRHIQEINNLMKTEKSKAIANEESEEKQKTDQILNQLNNA